MDYHVNTLNQQETYYYLGHSLVSGTTIVDSQYSSSKQRGAHYYIIIYRYGVLYRYGTVLGCFLSTTPRRFSRLDRGRVWHVPVELSMPRHTWGRALNAAIYLACYSSTSFSSGRPPLTLGTGVGIGWPITIFPEDG
jgi:hypothetical protein